MKVKYQITTSKAVVGVDRPISAHLRINVENLHNQRTIGPEKNAHLKPDLGVLSHHEMTLTLNTHTPLLTS